MAYVSSSVSGATPALDFMTAVHNNLTANGWTSVETTTASTYTAEVFKSAAAGNAQNADFYLSVIRNGDTAAQTIGFRVHEGYDSVNHKMQKFAPSSTNLTPAASTYLNSQADLTPAGSWSIGVNVAAAGTSTPYVLSITPNRVVAATRVGTNDYAVYAGLYYPSNPIDPFPLTCLNIGDGTTSSSSSYGSCTREPGQGSASTYNFFVQMRNDSYDTTGSPYISSGTQPRYSFTKWACPVWFHSSRDVSSAQRGTLRDVLWIYASTADLGDTATVDGVTYTLLGNKTGISQAL